MKCAVGLCGHCQFGPISSARTARSCATTASPTCSPCGRSEHGRTNATRGWRSGSSPPATAASFRCWIARTNCWRWPARSRSPISPRPPARWRRDPTTCRWSKARSPRPHDAERIRTVRRQSKFLVTIGACATAGGIQALRNFADVKDFVAAVYASPQYIKTLATSTPISAHVKVDFELRGCPIDKAAVAGGDRGLPRRPQAGHRRRTASASSASCAATPASWWRRARPASARSRMPAAARSAPPINRGCYGCFGPMERPNTAALAAEWQALGATPRDLHRVFRTFNAGGRTVPPGERGPWRASTIRVDTLARVEGEGALELEIQDGAVTGVRAEDLRAAALVRGAAARPRALPKRPTSPRASAASARSRTR